MKGYYLFAPTEAVLLGAGSGVEKKVRSQVASLQKYCNVELTILPPAHENNSILRKIWKRLPFTRVWRRWSYEGEYNNADFLYIRQVYHDDAFVRYLKKIKNNNPDIKIIYEVPTYPYGEDVKLSISNYSMVKKEQICRVKAAKFFDRIVTFYGQESIWGVSCIKLRNGFDFKSVTLPSRTKLPKEIHIISVAQVAFWHGYEREIRGLGEYYSSGGKEQIIYHYVGEPLQEHLELAKHYGIDGTVVQFHGKMSGAALQQLLSQSCIGIDVLGGHRVNYKVSSSLKSREYAAYGIPVVTASPIDYLPTDYPFQLIVPYDDSSLNIDQLLEFYHNIYDRKECNKVASEIRTYAEARCDMDVTMKPVADWILSDQ